MNKINNYIYKNINLLIGIFLILQPIIDLLTGISIKFDILFSFGIVIRVMFMLFALYYLLFISKSLYRKKSIFLLSTIFIYMLLFIIIHPSFFEISNLIRTFYFSVVFINLFNIYTENKMIDNKYLLISLLIYVGVIFIADITNTAFNSYEIAKTGHVGWFNAANEVGAIIAILLPVLLEEIRKKVSIAKIILLFLTIYISFKVGTRIPLVSLFICISVYYIKYMILSIKDKSTNRIISGILIPFILLISLIILIPQTPIYKNIEIHTKYLKIDNIEDIYRNPKTIDHFIFSERFKFLSNTNKVYKNNNLFNKIIGIGYSSNKKMIEMDIFDILYRHGIGFIIYFGSIIYLIIDYKKKNINKNYLLPLFLILFISFFAGHVFTAPAVSIFVIIILLKLLNEKNNYKKKLLLCAYDLNIGGIETALINLLNNMDYKKYDITLTLERKQGVLLNRINNNVKIVEYKVSNNKNILIRKTYNLIKKIIYIIFNYKSYDASCCYVTYSLPCNMISRLSSNNSSIYVHSNYYLAFKKDEKKVKEFFDIRSLDQFNNIIFVSNEAKDDLCNIYPNIKDKSLVINNIVDQDSIIKLSKEKVDYKKNKDDILFVFVGRIDESSKKLSRMIQVFDKLITKNKNIKLLIVGNGKDFNYVNNIVKDKKLEKYITFVGEKLNPYPYMNMADYIILTSDYEGFPVVYNEAIVLNKKIITTIDASDDYIKIPNNFGYIVSIDIDEMVKQINDILKNDNLKMKKLDFETVNKQRIEKLDKIFSGVK